MLSIEAVIKNHGWFVFWWCLAVLLLTPLVNIFLYLYSDITNIRFNESVKKSVASSKRKATLLSFVAGFSGTFLIFSAWYGLFHCSMLIVKHQFSLFTGLLNVKLFVSLWLVSTLIKLELARSAGKLVFISYPVRGFANLVFAFFFSMGITYSFKSYGFPADVYWICSSIAVFVLRINFWKGGVREYYPEQG